MGEAETLYAKIMGEAPKTFVPLQDGFSNVSYLADGSKVFRIKKASDSPFYDAKEEGAILELAAGARLFPRIYYFNGETGDMVDAYIVGGAPFLSPDASDRDLRALARLIKRLHEIKGCSFRFDAKRRFDSYKSRSRADLRDPEEAAIRERAEAIIDAEPLVLSHNDLVAGNVIRKGKSGQIVLLDFEFAGLNNEMFDLASLLSESEILDEHKWDVLLTSYFAERMDAAKRKKLVLFMQYENYLWHYWAKCRERETKLPSFRDIAEMKEREIAFFRDFYKKRPDYLSL
jgi:thiamine kinase-like enzyme